jgi:capsular polysaccharide biosynthesis protein
MTVLKYDHEKRPDFQGKDPDVRAHYEDVVARTLLAMKRRWRLIALVVASALTLACVVIPLLPRQYTATALVYPNLFSGGREKLSPLASVDAASIVTSEARLIVSDAILQAVVRRLEMDPGSERGRSRWWTESMDWLRAMFFPETRNHSPFDRQVAMLRNKVEVAKDTRSYLIFISFTTRSADEAARIVNAIAIEYLRDKTIQRRQDAVAAAEGELGRQLGAYGEKHPKVLKAADELVEARAALKEVVSPETGHPETFVGGESIKLAVPNRTPTSPRGTVILALSIILGLVAGIGLALWCDRRGLEPRRFLAGLPAAGVCSGGDGKPSDSFDGSEPDAARSPRRRGRYSNHSSAAGQPPSPPGR